MPRWQLPGPLIVPYTRLYWLVVPLWIVRYGPGSFARISYSLGAVVFRSILNWLRPTLLAVNQTRVEVQQGFAHLEKIVMATAADIQQALSDGFAALNTETNDIATLITTLAGKITPQMSDADLAALKANFTTLSQRLVSLAVDPTNPVPPAPAPVQALKKSLGR